MYVISLLRNPKGNWKVLERTSYALVFEGKRGRWSETNLPEERSGAAQGGCTKHKDSKRRPTANEAFETTAHGANCDVHS